MTPPEHLFIGFSLGNVMYAAQNFFSGRRLPYPVLLLLAGMMALLPDIDSFFRHYASKDIFFGHRGITHSLLFIFAVSCILTLAFMMVRRFRRSVRNDEGKALYITFFLTALMSGFSHLLADLPTPSGYWGGIPVFFPLSVNGEYVRSGGWSRLGWFDYRIQWMYIAAFLVSLILILSFMLARRFNRTALKASMLAAVIVVNACMYLWTIDHVRGSRYTGREQWMAIQDGYLQSLGPGIRNVTVKGQKYFLKMFHKLR